MKTALVTIYFLMCVFPSFSQANEWAWVNGDSTVNNNSVYGINGVAAPGNKPSSRWLSISWTDKSGNLWLYGGSSDASLGSYHLNDLWGYNIAGNEWKWVSGDTTAPINGLQGIYGTKGIAAPGNKPGGKSEAVSWTDNDGNLWLFGGGGPDASLNIGLLNDLWEYNITGNEWTWVNGDSVINKKSVYGTKGVSTGGNPGSRTQGVTWTDNSNNLWMFGGAGYDALGNYGELDDLWKFNVASNQWTWIAGDTIVSVNSVYGTKEVAAPQNKPGGRVEAVSWFDSTGNLWLFGGYGYPAKGAPLELNDLWKYSVANNQWAWINGDTVIGIYGHYGTQGIPNPENKPGSARWSVSWADYSGNLWLFGGYGYGGGTNALWKYNIATGQWTWMTGDTTGGIYGVYGTKGIPDTANTPGTKQSSISWTDHAGNLWLFGDDGFPAAAVNANGNMNDLWRFNPGNTIQPPVTQNCASLTLTVSPTDTVVCLGQSVKLSASATYNGSSYDTINLQSSFNKDWANDQNPMIIPAGYNVLGGVPFTLGCSGCNNSWAASVQGGNNPITLAIPLHMKIDSLFSLINCYWGETGGPYAAIQLKSNGQVVYQQNLWGDTDIRDFNPNVWTNFINGTSTVNVYVQPVTNRRLDMVKTALPANLLNTVIDSILYVDNGATNFQRIVVTGVTVKAIADTGINYLWSTGDTTSSITISPLQNASYSVVVTTRDSACSSADSILVSVLPAPADSITTGKNIFCPGDSSALCTLPGFVLYQWNVPGLPNVNCINAHTAGTYYVTVTDTNGCTATSNQISISIDPVPVDSIAADKDIFCTGGSSDICALYGFVVYQWNVPGSPDSNCINATDAGNYYVTVTDNNGCTAESNHVSISVYPVPSVSIVVQGDTLSSFGAVSYQWYLNGDSIPNAINPVYIVHQPGNYSVEITDTNGCRALSNSTYVTVTGVSQPGEGSLLTIYPDPFNNTIFIKVDEAGTVIRNIKIYDVLGRIMLNSEYNSSAPLILPVDVSALTPGAYYIKVETNQNGYIHSIIKN